MRDTYLKLILQINIETDHWLLNIDETSKNRELPLAKKGVIYFYMEYICSEEVGVVCTFCTTIFTSNLL